MVAECHAAVEECHAAVEGFLEALQVIRGARQVGLYNLTNDEVPALVHFDADRREPRTLIRLKNPEEQSGQ